MAMTAQILVPSGAPPRHFRAPSELNRLSATKAGGSSEVKDTTRENLTTGILRSKHTEGSRVSAGRRHRFGKTKAAIFFLKRNRVANIGALKDEL